MAIFKFSKVQRKFWNQVWYTPVIPAVRRGGRRNTVEFEANLNCTVWASLAYRMRTCLQKNQRMTTLNKKIHWGMRV